jgi:cardiolipin synthase
MCSMLLSPASRSSLARHGLAAVALSLAACSGTESKPAPPKADASAKDSGHTDAAMDAASSDASEAVDAGVTRTLITEPDQGITPFYDVVTSAKKTIDVTMYELRDTTFTGLLTTAAAKGVAVRVILDQNLEMHSNTAAYDALMAGNVSVHWANTVYAATHQKTITVDGRTSAVMSLNLVTSDYATTRDFAVITNDAADVAAIETVFGDDFTNATVTPPLGDDLVWSPTNSESVMVGLIKGAKTSLLVENEEMSDTDVVAALEIAATSGVNVEIVMTASNSWDTEFTTLVADGAKVVTYAENASLYIHAKVILADFGEQGAQVLIGSENFSNASLTENRELGVILTDPSILTSINTTLSSDFKGGTAY